MIAPLRTHLLSSRRNPILTRSRSAMAQFASEPLLTLASEVVSASVPPTPASIPSVPFMTQGFHPVVSRAPQYAVGHWQPYAPLDPVAESILMTTTRVLEAALTPLS